MNFLKFDFHKLKSHKHAFEEKTLECTDFKGVSDNLDKLRYALFGKAIFIKKAPHKETLFLKRY